MTFWEIALAFDLAEHLPEAAWAYEIVLREEGFPVEACLNLAGVYCALGDPGYAGPHRLDPRAEGLIYPAASSMLARARRHYPADPELPFWELYCSERLAGAVVQVKEYERLAQSGESLLPYLEIFGASRGTVAMAEAEKLLEIVKEGRTAREREVRSVLLSSVLPLRQRHLDLYERIRRPQSDLRSVLDSFPPAPRRGD